MWVLANYMNSRGQLDPPVIVSTVMTNLGLETALRDKDIKLKRTDVGDKYVLDELLRSGAALGGEQSGHIIFPKTSLAGDGIITTIMLLRVMNEQRQSLAELTKGLQRYPQLLLNVRVLKKTPFEEMPSVQSAAREIQERLDGRGRLLLRYSGTEALARVMIEGENESKIRDYAQHLADAIRREIGAPES